MSIAIETVTHESYVVDGKTYKNKEDAEKAIAALENVQVGLEFVQAQYPELAPRAQRTKANLIGEYLDWVDAGKPELTEEEKAERFAKADAKRAAASDSE